MVDVFGELQDVWEPDEALEVFGQPVDPRTRWSPIGQPIADPDRHALAATLLTKRRTTLRVMNDRRPMGELIKDAVLELDDRMDRDIAILEGIGARGRRTQPWTGLSPASVLQLRNLVCATCERNVMATGDECDDHDDWLRWASTAADYLGTGLIVTDAVPFFLPSPIATQLMTSEPPDETLTDNIRLPFPTILVFFEDAVALGDVGLAGRVAHRDGIPLDADSAALVGVLIAAGSGGAGVDPVVHWIVTVPGPDAHGVIALPGVWAASAQPAVIANVAALCTWGTWTPPAAAPAQLEGDPDSRQWRRSLKRNAVRKAIRHGAVVGVHVIDLAGLDANGSRGDGQPSGRSVRTHWRRGYWNSVRVATRDSDGTIIGDRRNGVEGIDWHYEGRWIHPVLVRGTANNGVTVYTVPETPI